MTRSGQRVVFVGPSTPSHDLTAAFDVIVPDDRAAMVDLLETSAADCVVVDGTEADRLATVTAARDVAPSVPILYVTATPDGTAAAAATRAGATEYFARTVDETLVDRVTAVSLDRPLTNARAPEHADPDAIPGSGTAEPDHATVVADLLETTRSLFSCQSRADVAGVVVDAAERVLGYDIATVRLHAEETDDLVLTAASDAVGEPIRDRERIDLHGTPMGEAFRHGEPVTLANVRTDSPYEYERVQSSMYVPIGDHGLFNVGSPVGDTFDDHHAQLARLLTASAAAALERADREEELRRHEQVLQTVEGMVYAVDADARLTLVTDPLAERLGYDREELVGEPVSRIFADESYERAVRHVRELLADPDRDSGAFEASYVTAEGERFPVEIECSLLPPDGDATDDGPFRGTVSVVRDITQRKEREQYMQVLNRVLRHNLRNDLTVVIGYADLLRERLDEPELATATATLRETATDLVRTSEKIRAIQYALDRDGDLEPTDVVGIAEAAIDDIESDGATVSVSATDACWAWADPGLELVVENLLENAIRHAGDAPTVEVSVTRDGEQVRLAVADDGAGIPPAEIEVVTGKSDITQLTHSSGLGLWLVHWMVDSYGGTVSFSESALGGSRVEIVLEVAPSDSTDAI